MNRVLPALLLIAASAGAENVELTLRVDIRPLAPRKGSARAEIVKPVKAETDQLQVTLGRQFIVVADEEYTTILDFARRVRFTVENKDVVISSLFAAVGGRAREMENRMYLAEMLDKSGAENPLPLAVSEHNLSMVAEPPAKEIQRDVKPAAVRFRWKNVPLGEYSASTLPASDEERKAFSRFVRYNFGGHPLLLADLEKAKGIPSRLVLVDDLGGFERVISVIKLQRHPDAPYVSPSNARVSLVSDALWGPIIDRAASLSPEAVAAHAKSLEAAAEAAVTANQLLDAFLLYMEIFLTAGDMPSGLQRHGPKIMADPTVARVRKAISPGSAEEATKALEVLEGTRKANPDRAHVLRIFEANILTNLGDTEKAYEQFHAVLSTQPRIAGVWHDLGMLFLGNYNADAAWDCWDVARRFAPRHSMLTAIGTREKSLVEKYPDFF